MSSFARRLSRVTSPAPLLPSAWPDDTNTGWRPTGTTLSPTGATTGLRAGNIGWQWQGIDIKVTQDNAVIDGIDIQGVVNTSNGFYKNMTVRNSWIRGDGVYDGTTLITVGEGCLLEDTEVGGGVDGATFNKAIGPRVSGASGAIAIMRRVNSHHLLSGARPGGDALVEDCYLHLMPMGDPVQLDATGGVSTTEHSGGIMIENGFNNTLRHNTIEGGNSAGLFVQDYDQSLPGIGNLLIDHNRFVCNIRNGQAPTWGVSVENKFIKGPVTANNNVFTRNWEAGPMLLPESTTDHPLTINHSGNIFEDDNSSVDAVTEYHPFQF